jgi:hypothetical protein
MSMARASAEAMMRSPVMFSAMARSSEFETENTVSRPMTT